MGTSWSLAPHGSSSGELPVAKGHNAQPADPGVSCSRRMGSKSPGNTSQPPAFFSKLTESNSAMVKSKKQEINKKLNTHNRNEPEYSKGKPGLEQAPGGR